MTIHWGLKTRNDRSVQETEQYLYSFFTSDPPPGPTVLSAFTTAGARDASSSCFTADRRLISALPPPISQMDHWHSIYNLNLVVSMVSCKFLAQTDHFMFLDLNVLSRAAGFNLVLSEYVLVFFSQSRESHWLPLYDWQTATVWVKNLCLCSTEETKSPTSWMPLG